MPAVDSEPFLDLQEVAAELGVHYQTAYGWVRSGSLPSVMVHGRYSIARADLETFRASREQPVAPSDRIRSVRLDGHAERFFETLVAGDESEVRRAIGRLVDRGVPFTRIVDAVFVPALRRIGSEWHAGNLTIGTEHRASAIVGRLLGGLYLSPRGRRRGTVAVAGLSGDRHVLPTDMAAAALREDHWFVHHLGADMPAEEILRFVDEHPVDLVVITVTNPAVGSDAEQVADRLRQRGVRSLVGAPGRSLTELVETARHR